MEYGLLLDKKTYIGETKFDMMDGVTNYSKNGMIWLHHIIRWSVYFIGLIVFSFGITVTIYYLHLGLSPWDVLNVAMFQKLGLTIGTWNIIISFTLIVVSWILDKSYIKIGTFINAILIGAFVDLYMWLDFIPQATHTWLDIIYMSIGIVIMGVGGGVYNAAGVGSGPRDGFMLSISDKTKQPIGRIRIIIESTVLVIGWILGGPVFVVTFIFTFIQSPIFQFVYLRLRDKIIEIEAKYEKKRSVS